MRCAVITGGGTGIGRATALRLARDGRPVALVGRRAEPLEAATAEIKAAGGTALAVPADITSPEQAEMAMHRAAEAFGGIEVLVNNAGTAPSLPLMQTTPEQWRQIMETNLSAAFYTTRAAWPYLKNGGGVVVNISSVASRDPFPGLGAYGAAKAGVNLMTLALAREGHDAGVRAVCIAPAAVDTQMFRTLMGGRPIKDGIMLDPGDVAAMIADAVGGSLRYCSGDTLFVHRRPM